MKGVFVSTVREFQHIGLFFSIPDPDLIDGFLWKKNRTWAMLLTSGVNFLGAGVGDNCLYFTLCSTRWHEAYWTQTRLLDLSLTCIDFVGMVNRLLNDVLAMSCVGNNSGVAVRSLMWYCTATCPPVHTDEACVALIMRDAAADN